MKKKTKMAVLLYGQPRFIKENIEGIKKEFTFHEDDNVEVDFFCHFWSQVGYNPDDDIRQSYHDFEEEELVRKTLQPKSITKESQESIHDTCKQIASYISSINDILPLKDKNTDKTIFTATDYKGIIPIVGQLLSIERVAESLGNYEEETQTKYDVVVRARTDLRFIPQDMYKDPSRYWRDKYYTYVVPCLENKNSLCCLGGLQYWTNSKRESDGRIYPTVTGLRSLEFDDRSKNMTLISKSKSLVAPTHEKYAIHLKDWLFFGDSNSIKEHSKHLCFRWLKYSHDEMSSFLQNEQAFEWGALELINGMQAVDKNINVYNVDLDNVFFWERFIKIQTRGKEKELHVKQKDTKETIPLSCKIWYNDIANPDAVFINTLNENQMKHVNPEFLKC